MKRQPGNPPRQDSDLVEPLERCLAEYSGSHRVIAELRRVPLPYRTSFAIESLDLRFEDGERLELVFKDLSRAALAEPARAAKPEFLYDPLREIETYRDILSTVKLGTPEFHGAAVEPDLGRYWLFIGKVRGIELVQSGSIEVWREAARWLARLRRALDAASGPATAARHLLRYDAAFYRRWPARALRFSSENTRRKIAWLSGRYGRVVDCLIAMPRSFVHGEFYASNVLVGDAGICPVDWEMAAIGPAPMDLAALTLGKWTSIQRETIVRAYWEDLRMPGTWAPDELLQQVDYCRLHLCMQWLGWSANWQPPAEQAHDWLGEALNLAAKLNL